MRADTRTNRAARKAAWSPAEEVSGKAHAHGGNVQAVLAPGGFPLWVSDVQPGSEHDLTAARTHALPALYRAAAADLRHRTGFSPRVPAHRAAECDEAAIAAWRATTWAKVRG
jgi:Winged helix-turn helix/DDE superfamily endonuclease